MLNAADRSRLANAMHYSDRQKLGCWKRPVPGVRYERA